MVHHPITPPDLVTTKLRRPSLPARWINRPHLSHRLHEGLAQNRSISLVSAPAGYGKTTCVCAWLSELETLPDAWLALETADSDPFRFFLYFIAALQRFDSDLGRDVARTIRSGQLPPAEAIATNIVNGALNLPAKSIVVLDDFHVIQDGFVLDVLEKVFVYLPESLHAVLITRKDPPLPLGQLRARNRITEIRARDLRVNTHDAERFLNDVMDLSLSITSIAALEEKTEGWFAGLQLAGLSIGDRHDPTAFIAALNGSHRHILDYLTEQVLDRQPKDVQQFLLQTSVLSRLNGDLCNAVTRRSDARTMLEELLKANLFVAPLDDERRWYRYHHLFGELLRDRQVALDIDETSTLHQRASEWYARAGMEHEAIEHALAAKDYETAVALLDDHAMELIMQGYAGTVNRWVQEIPEKWEALSPQTNIAFGWMHLLRGAYRQASDYIERSRAGYEAALDRDERAALEAEWLVMESLMMYWRGRPGDARDLASRALVFRTGQDGRVRSLAYYALASASKLLGDNAGAMSAYQKSIDHARLGDNSVPEMLSSVGLALAAFEHGELTLAYEIIRPLVDRLERSVSQPPISAVLYGLLGEVHYQWFRIDEAYDFARRAHELSVLGGYASGVIGCHVLLARIHQRKGNLSAAGYELQQAVERLHEQVPTDVRCEVETQQARDFLDRNVSSAAMMILERYGFSYQDQFSFPDIPSGSDFSFAVAHLYACSLQAILSHAPTKTSPIHLKAGIRLANRLIERAEENQYRSVSLLASLLRAQMETNVVSGASSSNAGLADYVRALELGQAEGFITIFLEQGSPVAHALSDLQGSSLLRDDLDAYAAHILDSFSQVQRFDNLPVESDDSGATQAHEATAHTGGPIEPLTPRELEVLALMAEGQKYREIAANLVISVNTVRYHVKAIYGKLGVNNRTQAIEVARQLHIF